jgi:hypothetical protein
MLSIYNKYGQLKVVTSTSSSGVASVSAVAPITSTGGSNPIISTLITPNKLLGRHSASTGVMQEITLGTGLVLSGNTLNVTTSSYTFTSPLVNTLGVVSINQSNSTTNGYLSSADWTVFNGKQNALSGTGFVKSTAGVISYDTSAYTPTSRNLTINGVTYDLSADRSWTISAGTVSSVGLSMPSAFTVTNSPVTTSGTLTVTGAGTSSQYIKGDGTLATFPTIPTISGTIDYFPVFTGTNTLGNSIMLKTPFGIAIGTNGSGIGTGLEYNINASTPRVDFVVNNVYTGQFSASTNAVNFKATSASANMLFLNGSNGLIERMRISTTGNVLIGTSTDDSINKLQVSGYTKATGYRIPGGLSTSFLKADGSIDNNTYLTTAVTSVSATSPITSSGGTTPTISTSMSTNKLIGRSTAGTGIMEEITVGTGLSLSSGTLSATASSSVGFEMNFLLMGA